MIARKSWLRSRKRQHRARSPGGWRSCSSAPFLICISPAPCSPTQASRIRPSTRCRSRPSPLLPALDLIFSFIAAEANRSSLVHLLRSPQWRFAEIEADGASTRRAGRRARRAAARAEVPRRLGTPRRPRRTRGRRATVNRARSTPPRSSRVASPGDCAPPSPRRARSRRCAAAASSLGAVRGAARVHPRPRTSARCRRPVGGAASPHPGGSPRRARVAGCGVRAPRRCADDDRSAVRARSGGGSTARRLRPSPALPRIHRKDPRACSCSTRRRLPYADVDELRLVGLVEPDWPERARRSIFYPANLLSQLGWPNESDRLAAARARFHDLLRLPRERVSVSTFTLEDDAIVAPSPLLEEVDPSGLAIERPEAPGVRVGVRARGADWRRAADGGIESRRRARRVAGAPSGAIAGRGRGFPWLRRVRARRPSTRSATWSAISNARSSTSRRACCTLDEEREDESGLSPQERGPAAPRSLRDVLQALA